MVPSSMPGMSVTSTVWLGPPRGELPRKRILSRVASELYRHRI
jgi:hypothetical protein